MTERLSSRKSISENMRKGIAVGALFLCASSASACQRPNWEADDEPTMPPMPTGEVMLQDLPANNPYPILRPRVTYKSDGESLNLVADTLPPNYSAWIAEAIKDPIVGLAVQENEVSGLHAAIYQQNDFDLILKGTGPYENGEYTYLSQAIDLTILDGELPPEDKTYTDNLTTRMVIVHEALHGLNIDWQLALADVVHDLRFADKVQSLQQTCMSVTNWIARQAADQKVPINTASPNVCEFNDDIATISAREKNFQCVTEGDMVKEMRDLDYVPPYGHPEDNAYELAASELTVLYFDPEYLVSCFNNQEPEAAAVIKKYIKEVLELSFLSKPELELLLRQNPETSEAIDYILATV